MKGVDLKLSFSRMIILKPHAALTCLTPHLPVVFDCEARRVWVGLREHPYFDSSVRLCNGHSNG